MKIQYTKDYALLIDEGAEIKPKDIFLSDNEYIVTCKKNVSKSFINGNFYRSRCAKILAYKKLNKKAKELDLPLLPEFNNEVDIEKLGEEYARKQCGDLYDTEAISGGSWGWETAIDFVNGYKAAQSKANFNFENLDVEYIIKDCFGTNDNSKILLNELTHDDLRTLAKNSYSHGYTQSKQFSLEDIENAFYMGWIMRGEGNDFPIEKRNYIQSLSTQQLPKEFISEYETIIPKYIPYPKELEVPGQGYEVGYPITEKILKTITNSEGKEELVGTYKY